MANKRNIKKDIEYLVYEVVSDCYTFKYLYPENEHKEADSIIGEAIQLRNDLIMRVNHPDGKDDKKLVKKHFNKINEDLLNKIDEFFTRLNEMLAKAQKPTDKKAVKETEKTEKEDK
ncbi:MAG: hypothetical protein GXO79_04005 [Chlorobi bacterium]|nr:hypothetical protein [Chlorobiota bacterium]